RFVTRNQQDWTGRLEALVRYAREIPAKSVILDGELVVQRADGTTNFQDLQNALREPHSEQLVYWVFDLLHLDGIDLRTEPLAIRKQTLRQLLHRSAGQGPLQYSDHIVGNGQAFWKEAQSKGLEGIVSKRSDRPYQSGRTTDWLKI